MGATGRAFVDLAAAHGLLQHGDPLVAGDAVGADRRPVAVVVAADKMGQMFFLFNNRLGCLGSLLVSLVGTAVLVMVLVLVNGR